MDTCVVSMPWLSWIMLQQIWECRYLFEIVISFPSDIYPKVRLLDRMVVGSIFNFFRKPPCHFPYGLYQFKFLPTVHKGSLFQKGFKNLLFVGSRNFIKPLTSLLALALPKSLHYTLWAHTMLGLSAALDSLVPPTFWKPSLCLWPYCLGFVDSWMFFLCLL